MQCTPLLHPKPPAHNTKACLHVYKLGRQKRRQSRIISKKPSIITHTIPVAETIMCVHVHVPASIYARKKKRRLRPVYGKIFLMLRSDCQLHRARYTYLHVSWRQANSLARASGAGCVELSRARLFKCFICACARLLEALIESSKARARARLHKSYCSRK